MTVYVVAKLKINDRETYAKYSDGFMDILPRYGGKLLSVDDGAEVIEGDWPYNRTVLLEFPDKAGMQTWYNSPEYRDLVKHRYASSTAEIALIKGWQDVEN
ncbi:hypothetical protein HAD_13124 [Hyphomonas adhaerens MHS-3]|uniref:DUF1330 domain-containing protein n=1 Tax=Hyphomonas adhaerens MHS-3 TaxID=1280949 RepID=A0A069E260_9PROT|nr:DUF1330 domain-containing protein [Hyphomonas adhaerens]KCZ83545.1 hypothetical protein HAD_13124 [Hyphomonas adhaerens MHS-3]